MNKSLVGLALVTLNTYTMDRLDSFGGLLDPERIIAAASSELFSGPLPIVTQLNQSEQSDTDKEFSKMAEAFAAFNTTKTQEKQNSNLRRLISFNDALKLGKLTPQAETLEFDDFELSAQTPKAKLSLTYSEANSHIYNLLVESMDGSKGTGVFNAPAVESKIYKNASCELSDEELYSFQLPQFMLFLTNLDLNIQRKRESQELQENNDISTNEKNAQINKIEDLVRKIMAHRARYFAAIASRNPQAIIDQNKRASYLHLTPPSSLVEEIQEFRSKSREHNEKPDFEKVMDALRRGEAAPGQRMPIIIGAPGCQQS